MSREPSSMFRSAFEYYGSIVSSSGGRVGDVRLEVDWIPALRWAEFERELVFQGVPGERSAHPVIEPVWSELSKRPYIGGVRIQQNEQGDDAVDFGLGYFSSAVTEASSQLVKSGALVIGERFEFEVFALTVVPDRHPDNGGHDVVAVDTPPVIESTELAPLMAKATAHNGNIGAPGSTTAVPTATVMPIFVPRQVLNEATELARCADDVETGGILVGKLGRDKDGTLFSRVTAQIPAEYTTSTRQSLTFTPKTWINVNAAIRLRGMGELVLGWWHNHPYFCWNCLPSQRALCPFSTPAFSDADRNLHREVFQKSWSIGLLLSFLGEEYPSYDIFAWNHGQIEAVKFFSLPLAGSNTEESP